MSKTHLLVDVGPAGVQGGRPAFDQRRGRGDRRRRPAVRARRAHTGAGRLHGAVRRPQPGDPHRRRVAATTSDAGRRWTGVGSAERNDRSRTCLSVPTLDDPRSAQARMLGVSTLSGRGSTPIGPAIREPWRMSRRCAARVSTAVGIRLSEQRMPRNAPSPNDPEHSRYHLDESFDLRWLVDPFSTVALGMFVPGMSVPKGWLGPGGDPPPGRVPFVGATIMRVGACRATAGSISAAWC